MSEKAPAQHVAELVERAEAEKLWSPAVKSWFEDGLDTPGLTLVTVHADSADRGSPSSSETARGPNRRRIPRHAQR